MAKDIAPRQGIAPEKNRSRSAVCTKCGHPGVNVAGARRADMRILGAEVRPVARSRICPNCGHREETVEVTLEQIQRIADAHSASQAVMLQQALPTFARAMTDAEVRRRLHEIARDVITLQEEFLD